MRSTLNILYQSSDLYSMITGVSLVSLLKNNREIDDLSIFLINDGISNINLCRLQTICDNYHRNLTIVDPSPIKIELEKRSVAPFRGRLTTYYKLLVIDKLQIRNGNILTLDSDTIIDKYIGDLCDVDLQGKMIGATYDCTLSEYKLFIGLTQHDKYYNGGVLLIDQKRWINTDSRGRILNHLSHVRSGYHTADQDILNIVFQNEIGYLDLKYNFNSGFFIYGIRHSFNLYNLNQNNFDSLASVQIAMQDIHIYHCMGAMTGRPWEVGNIHPQNQLFDTYLKMTPWKIEDKIKPKIAFIFLIQRFLFQILPIQTYIPLHKLIQRKYLVNNDKKTKKQND